jgi:transposase InsO family protein
MDPRAASRAKIGSTSHSERVGTAAQLSLSTIQKVLQKHQVKPLKKTRRYKEVKKYQCELPGERVQMDTCKIGPGVYQYTAVDDCTRYKVVAVVSRISAKNTL